jgi:hypothetical protein
MEQAKDMYTIWRWGLAVVLLCTCGLAAFGAYFRMGTTVIEDSISPDGRWDAVLMVRNGGAMTGYVTAVSVVRANWITRQLALCALYRTANVFVADDNDELVALGSHNELNVKLQWVSKTDLIVAYPDGARVYREDFRFRSVSIQYIASQ